MSDSATSTTSTANQNKELPASSSPLVGNKFQIFERWLADNGLLDTHRENDTTNRDLDTKSDGPSPHLPQPSDSNGPPQNYPLPLESDSSLSLPTPISFTDALNQASAPLIFANESGKVECTSSFSSSCDRINSTVSIDNDKQQLPGTSQCGDDVVVSVGSIQNNSVVPAQQPPITILETTLVDEEVCDAVPFQVDRNSRLPPSPSSPSPPDNRHRGRWKRNLGYYVFLGLVSIAIGAVVASIVITLTNNSKTNSESIGTDNPLETAPTEAIGGVTMSPETLAPSAAAAFVTDSDSPFTLAPSTNAPSTDAPSTPAPSTLASVVASPSSTNCIFCEGYAIHSELISGNNMTCSQVNEYAPTLSTGSDECTLLQLAEAECCKGNSTPVSPQEAIDKIQSMIDEVMDDSEPSSAPMGAPANLTTT